MSAPPRRSCSHWCWRTGGCTSWTTAAGTPTWSKSSWKWSKEATMAAELTLQPVAVRGRYGDFRNLLRNELAAFWGTPTWLIQVGTWLVFGPGFLLLFLLTESLGAGQEGRASRAAIELAARVLPATAGTLVAIAAVILAQGKIVGEKQSGTAAWVLSKPVSRSAFVLAKFLALGSGMVATAVAVPGAGAWAVAAV